MAPCEKTAKQNHGIILGDKLQGSFIINSTLLATFFRFSKTKNLEAVFQIKAGSQGEVN